MARTGYRRYDPRLRNLVASSDNIDQFMKLGIPKSTLMQWLRDGPKEYFTIPELDLSQIELAQENIDLKAKLAVTFAEQTLVAKTINIFGFQIQYRRLPTANAKDEILDAIKNAAQTIPLQSCLASIGLTAARYHNWLKRKVKCLLQDQTSCPRVSPTKLLQGEVHKIRDIFTSKEFAHFSTTALAWFAKKSGEVVASAETWSRIIRQLGLKRRSIRFYPPKPKVGIRASAPCQIWHLDQTILRLQDGTRAFVQAVIDNYSRFVLAWKVTTDYGGAHTKDLLEELLVAQRKWAW